MTSAFFTLLIGLFWLLCFYFYLRYNHWKRNGIPTAKGYVPILGHLLPVAMKRIHFTEFIRKIYNEHKDRSMIGIYNGTTPALIVRDLTVVKTVLQSNFSSFHENAFKVDPNIDPFLAKDPSLCTGDAWLNGRKRLTYAFTNVRLKVLLVAVNGVCKKFEDFLNRQLETKNKYEVELKPLFLRFTGEVVANAGLGIEGQCFEDETTPSAFDQLTGNALMVSLTTLIWRYFPAIGRLLKLKVLPKRLDDFFRKVVAENLEIRRSEPIYRNDFLQLMIDMQKIGEKVDEEVIAAHAFSLYLNGTETSSLTLSYVGYNLAVHPNVQEKLRNEVMSAMEKHGRLTYEALKEMTYMNQVISESQRIYGVVGFSHKICTEEFELQGSDGLTYRAKPGAQIIIPIHALHNDPKYWRDPEVFDPERFNEERKQTIEKMSFLPFGDGPRICVGIKMAMLQMKACIATLLRSYRLELSSKTQVPLKISSKYLLSEVDGGIWVHISKL